VNATPTCPSTILRSNDSDRHTRPIRKS
jgi:hypothetical protein